MNVRPRFPLVGACLALTLTAAASAQGQRTDTARPAGGADTVRLGELHALAVRRDPRAAQLDVLDAQQRLRLGNIAAERLPALSLTSQAQYQSDVPSVPGGMPGSGVAGPPHDTYDASGAARQRLYDPSIGARRDVVRAELAESRARVRAVLYPVQESVSDAYFGVLLHTIQSAEVASGIRALEAQLELAVRRVAEGAALRGDAARLEAALIRRRQLLDELDTRAAAARRVLADLAGTVIAADDVLALPDLESRVAQVRAESAALRSRPEYALFARTREVLEQRERAVSAQGLPRITAYGRAGWGRPGLNPLASDFDTYWLTGVQVEWAPWTWGSTAREREVLALQRDIIASEEAAFTTQLERARWTERAEIERLERTRESDSVVIALRETILREATLQLEEGVIPTAEYVERDAELLDARLTRTAHAIELERARVRLLTLIGVEIP